MPHTLAWPIVNGRRQAPAARQQALLSAASELFAARGYEAATTHEIAAQAGCAEGLIHRYFGGKRGLLLALIEGRASQDVVELAHHLPLACTFAEEYLQLVSWEIESMWQDQNFLRVILSRTLVEPDFGEVLSKVGLSRHVPVFVERLSRFDQYRSLSEAERDGVAQSIKVLGLVFGFMRPVLLQQDREVTRKMATTIATSIVRGISA
jgi:TetR/AcrR family transcriptional regulator, regulator of cefoperazone and chloramphenicol sensitivity